MIYCNTGCQGSGKSLHAAKDIRYVVKNGGMVIANFDLNLECIKVKRKAKKHMKYVRLYDKDLLYPDLVVKLIKQYIEEHGVRYILVVLDECHKYFDSRQWNIVGRKEWLEFFAEHRHIGKEHLDILLITQLFTNLDKRIYKGMCETEYMHVKLTNQPNIFRIFGIMFNMCGYYERWVPGGSKYISRVRILMPLKRYTDIYDTHAEITHFDTVNNENKKSVIKF